MSFYCELTRHSDDVLKREKIFIEAHRGVTAGQKNHNTKEAFLNAIESGIESFETDAWLTKDNKVVLSHDGDIQIHDDIYTIGDLDWSKLHEIESQIPLLEDIMEITKGKIFMNLEIKDKNEKIWEKIKELIEKFEYYDQISISSFEDKYYQEIEKYNKDYNRKIVFGFLKWNVLNIFKGHIFNINKKNHQISINAVFLKNNPQFVKEVHDKGMTVGVWFFSEPNNRQYYDLFEIGVDVIITDYPIRVANQLKEYFSDDIYLEGCKSIEKGSNSLSSCKSCQIGYELVKIKESNRNLCKLKYEIDPDLYILDDYSIY